MKTANPAGVSSFILKPLFFLAAVLITLFSPAQVTDSLQKISPGLLKEINAGRITGRSEFRLMINPDKVPADILQPAYKAKKIFESGTFFIFSIMATVDELKSVFLPAPGVLFIESALRVPKEELLLDRLDLSANKINLIHRKYPALNGDGMVVSVKENKPDTTDIDFTGRFISTSLSSSTVSSHASIMATMIAGGGNSWHLSKGAAWGSSISSSSFVTLLPDANAAYQQYNISVQNHSYGVGVESYYGADAAAYDASAISNASLLHVFSSGNAGNNSPSTGTYAGLAGFANLTGSFKLAKNIITAGAADSFTVVEPLSSKGPAHDGRVKPELVAFGEDGTSGAAALVSGTSLLLQHIFKQMNAVLPPNALIKAILLNSADDAGNAEVDYAYGFGSLNAVNAIKTVQANRFFSGSVSNGGNQSFTISVPAGIKKLKATLVWNDPPAAPNAAKALINDLDFELIEISSGQIWQPWVLNHFPHPDSLLQPAKRNRDSLNNMEQVTLANPAPGNYQFRVTGFNVGSGPQNFFIAWQLDSIDFFEWNFPTASDFIFPSVSNTIRWYSTFAAANGMLEFSTDNGNNWQLIQNAISLATGYYKWNVPSFTTTALLRMTIGANQFVSDTFTIANRTPTAAGFNCPDSFLFYWSKLPGVTNYRVYKLGNKYLEPIATTADSFVLLAKSANPSLHYAVAPLIGSREGVKSYTFNYTTQGVECYLRSFLASLNGTSAKLDLLLGTLYNVNRIVLEKFDGSNFVQAQQISNPSSLQYSLNDGPLKKGANIYRIKLELAGGRMIYSSAETVYYFAGEEFIVYPNPAWQYQPITVLSDNQLEPATLQVINMAGQKIFEMRLDDISNLMPSGRLSKGLYLFRIVRKDSKDVVLKAVIR
jgi:hypothetical protein